MDIITNRETIYGTTIFNKEYILNQDSDKFNDLIKENEICCIDCDKLFLNGFNIIFKFNKIQIMYKNEFVTEQNIHNIIDNFYQENKNLFPSNCEIYLPTINKVIINLINSNPYTIIHTKNIPIHIMNLWLIKSKKINKDWDIIYKSNEFQNLLDIVQEKKYIKNNEINETKIETNINSNENNDELFRLEVCSNLHNDEFVDNFLNYCSEWDNFNKNISNIHSLIKLLEIIQGVKDKVGKIYFCNVIFIYIIKEPKLFKNENFKNVVIQKINEFKDDYFVKFSNLNINKEFKKNINIIQDIIKTIN